MPVIRIQTGEVERLMEVTHGKERQSSVSNQQVNEQEMIGAGAKQKLR